MDIVIGADPLGPEGEAAWALAHEQAWMRFEPLLAELMAEWPVLRVPVQTGTACPLQGGVAQRMWRACAPWADQTYITPMAAVAGSVAQELLACYARAGVARAWVNNGGDIALHLAPGQSVRVGLYADLARLQVQELMQGLNLDGAFEIAHPMPVRGVATSGWGGRSFSFGVADSVTVLAATAAQADVAATLIANAVNLDDPRIQRRPANSLRDDTDLGARLVTVDVPPLGDSVVKPALQLGLDCARGMQALGLIHAAYVCCQGHVLVAEPLECWAQ
jgi:ApbE superfamily uncharacterized protein (UPF0280 family)